MRLSSLSTILGLNLDRTADAAEELRESRLVDVDRDRVRISHDLFRSALYEGLGESRCAVLHRRLAEHLGAQGGPEVAGELSIHFDRAGEPELSAEHGWAAGARALDQGALAEAAHFYDLVARNTPDETRRAEATGQRALSLHLSRDMGKANPALELASTRLRAVGQIGDARRLDIRRVEGMGEEGHTPVAELIERLGAIKREASRNLVVIAPGCTDPTSSFSSTTLTAGVNLTTVRRTSTYNSE